MKSENRKIASEADSSRALEDRINPQPGVEWRPVKRKGRRVNVAPYLNFSGNCREAFDLYHQVIGGEIAAMITHADTPMEGMSNDWQDKILHARLDLGNGQVIMGSDAPPEWYSPPASVYVALQVDSVSDAERVFAGLSEGGTTLMPLGEQTWATRFGMLADRFGILWMITCD